MIDGGDEKHEELKKILQEQPSLRIDISPPPTSSPGGTVSCSFLRTIVQKGLVNLLKVLVEEGKGRGLEEALDEIVEFRTPYDVAVELKKNLPTGIVQASMDDIVLCLKVGLLFTTPLLVLVIDVAVVLLLKEKEKPITYWWK